MRVTIKEIMSFLREKKMRFEFFGDENQFITGFCSINNQKEQAITWVRDMESFDKDKIHSDTRLLVVTGKKVEVGSELIGRLNLIICENPKKAFFSIIESFFSPESVKNHISKQSVIETTAIGNNVSIGHFCFICKEALIGNNVVIGNNVSIESKTIIGDNTVINSGCVIGGDGYGYYENGDETVSRVIHLGGVTIGRDVEIGANTCIDRGTIDDTVIGNDVKIDNLCHISHNVIIKDKAMVVASSVLTGSSVIEEGAYVAPGSIVSNRVTIGQNSLVGSGAVVLEDVPPDKVAVGVPAKVIGDNNVSKF